MRHGSVIRPTMYLASMDTNTAFDVARPKHIAKIMGDHDVHVWIVAASLREMAGLEGQGKFESVESTFSVLKIAKIHQTQRNTTKQMLADVQDNTPP